MALRNILFITLLFSFIIKGKVVTAQNPDTLKINTKRSILNDKAFMLFPSQAKIGSKGTTVMSADPNANEETEIVLDMGKMRIVFIAKELYALGNDSILSEVTANDKKTASKTKVLTENEVVYSILSTPTQFDTTRKGIIINSLLVRTSDNSLFSMSVYINKEAFKQKVKFQKLSENIFKTLSNGKRLNLRNERTETRAIGDGKKMMVFPVPSNYCITVDNNADYQVFKYHKYQYLSDTTWLEFIIYAGRHPSPVYKEYKKEKSAA
ncbi:MAG: hypothetical protein ABI772_12115, partial [Bacteroidota bacterium]